MSETGPSRSTRANLAAATAFFLWGILPLYWKQFAWLPADRVIALRGLMCVPVLLGILAWRGELRAWLRGAASPKVILLHLVTAILLGMNWLIFVWATLHQRIVDASLGYFLNPLMNVLLGAVFLRERLRGTQRVAVALASVGVVIQVVGLGHVPWIALALSSSFSVYGLLRKTARLDSLHGLTLESMVFLPIAAGWLAFAQHGPVAAGAFQWTWVALLGLFTVFPLLAFAHAARKLTLTTLGLWQFMTPTLHFLCGWAVYGEPLEPLKLLSFVVIWTGLGVFVADLLRRRASR
jgi:chloramphenicol-sensitive protein RarD